MWLNRTIPISSHSPRPAAAARRIRVRSPARIRERAPAGRRPAAGSAGAGGAEPGAAGDGVRRRKGERTLGVGLVAVSQAPDSAGHRAAGRAAPPGPAARPRAGRSLRAGVSATGGRSGCDRARTGSPADSDGPVCRRYGGFRRGGAEAVGAVEHERGVPCAAVCRPDRPRAFARREREGRRQPQQRHDHVDGARARDLHRAPADGASEAEEREHRKAGHRHDRLQQLDVERHPQRRGGREQPERAVGLQGANDDRSARTSRAIMTPSIVSLRDVMTSTGSIASASAAARPAGTLHRRRTAE